jgi:hypothetical protein
MTRSAETILAAADPQSCSEALAAIGRRANVERLASQFRAASP